jgi:hypothetical protein
MSHNILCYFCLRKMALPRLRHLPRRKIRFFDPFGADALLDRTRDWTAAMVDFFGCRSIEVKYGAFAFDDIPVRLWQSCTSLRLAR